MASRLGNGDSHESERSIGRPVGKHQKTRPDITSGRALNDACLRGADSEHVVEAAAVTAAEISATTSITTAAEIGIGEAAGIGPL